MKRQEPSRHFREDEPGIPEKFTPSGSNVRSVINYERFDSPKTPGSQLFVLLTPMSGLNNKSCFLIQRLKPTN